MPPSKLKSFHGDRRYRVNRLRSRKKSAIFAKNAGFFGFFLLNYILAVLLTETQIAII